MQRATLRMGVDLGGTKIEAAIVDAQCDILHRQRCPTPQGDYDATLKAIVALISGMEQQHGTGALTVGICTPGSESPATGLLRNANSTCLNGRAFRRDLQHLLGREIRIANDADCLGVSEYNGGAAQGIDNVFAVILGTGVGGGVVIHGQPLRGANGISGEWGHTSLPWPAAGELPGPECWCGQQGCIETWLSGPALQRDFSAGNTVPVAQWDAMTLGPLAEQGDPASLAALERYQQRLARALAGIINVLDPQCIVLGGGLSNIESLYDSVPDLWQQWIFSDVVATQLRKPHFGDSSGVRGAAALWSLQEDADTASG